MGDHADPHSTSNKRRKSEMVSITGPCCGKEPYDSFTNMDVWWACLIFSSIATILHHFLQKTVWWSRNDSRPDTISLHALQRAAPSLEDICCATRPLAPGSRLLGLQMSFAEVHPICWHHGANSVARLRCRDVRGVWCKTDRFSGRSAGLEMQGSLPTPGAIPSSFSQLMIVRAYFESSMRMRIE